MRALERPPTTAPNRPPDSLSDVSVPSDGTVASTLSWPAGRVSEAWVGLVVGCSATGLVASAGLVGCGGRGLGVTVEVAVEEELGVGRTMVGAEGGWLTVVGADVVSCWDWRDSWREVR